MSIVCEESPEIEFVERDMPSQSHANAVAFLKNVDNLFPDNGIFSFESEHVESGQTVAIKVSKQNAFNDRDGI